MEKLSNKWGYGWVKEDPRAVVGLKESERDWQGKISNPEIKRNLKLCEYVRDFLQSTTQFLFAAQIHYKGVKLTPENSAGFRFYFVTRNL